VLENDYDEDEFEDDDIAEDIVEAAERYSDFHGEDAFEVTRHEMPPAAFLLGRLDAATYTVIEDGKEVTYHHDFETPPGLAISNDGKISIILAGEWSFTKRGFEG